MKRNVEGPWTISNFLPTPKEKPPRGVDNHPLHFLPFSYARDKLSIAILDESIVIFFELAQNEQAEPPSGSPRRTARLPSPVPRQSLGLVSLSGVAPWRKRESKWPSS